MIMTFISVCSTSDVGCRVVVWFRVVVCFRVYGLLCLVDVDFVCCIVTLCCACIGWIMGGFIPNRGTCGL
jgi:hypothetical protein